MISPKKLRKSGADAQINIVPYIDVMLVLLVIFMMTTPIIQQGVEVDLPKTKSGSKAVDFSNVLPTIISVNKKGEYYISSTNENDEDEKVSLGGVIGRVIARLDVDGEKPKIFIKGDRSVAYGKIISLMSDLKKNNAGKVGLITKPYDEK